MRLLSKRKGFMTEYVIIMVVCLSVSAIIIEKMAQAQDKRKLSRDKNK